ncbi:hypothetical protein BRAO375_3760002 [Bradyrhizobium sp. ORS 375]|nr:hypothetical protein BRAO375_3760002 [Bradyrhizobium sp. ORS 375]
MAASSHICDAALASLTWMSKRGLVYRAIESGAIKCL